MLPEAIRQTGKKFSETVAYISHEGKTITYRELDQFYVEVAAWMRTKGLSEGSEVA